MMMSVSKLFILLLFGLIFTLTSSRSLNISSRNNKTFGPFFRFPFWDVTGSNLQEIDIGNLPDVFSKTPRIMENNVELIELPVGTILHKAMKIPWSGVPSQTNILNTQASKNTWVTGLKGAKQYADWGYGDIVDFEVIKKIKLFDITRASNWKILWSRMDDQLKILRKRKIPSYVSNYAQMYIKQEINRLVFQQNIIQLSIGYGVTWEQQLQLILKFGDVVTNHYTDRPIERLLKEKCFPNDWFSINGRPTVLKSKTTTFGCRKKDLNRVSFTTALDYVMADTIAEFLNVDGYYSGNFPSLFHQNGFLIAEIAVHVPRDTLKVMDIVCKQNFYPCRSTCYDPKKQECLPGGLIKNYL